MIAENVTFNKNILSASLNECMHLKRTKHKW